MRSSTTKSPSKKGALAKALLKSSSPTKVKKNSLPPKKVKKLLTKNLVERPKKISKDTASSKDDEDSSDGDKNDPAEDKTKCKSMALRTESPTKKDKSIHPEKKDKAKGPTKKVPSKKPSQLVKPKTNSPKGDEDDDVKYKINAEMLRKVKNKTTILLKNAVLSQKKKGSVSQKSSNEKTEGETVKFDSEQSSSKLDSSVISDKIEDSDKDQKIDNKTVEGMSSQGSSTASFIQETPKGEVERPPKFFTSSRSPRTVDIDVKCFKTSKGNLVVSERFLPLKCETKPDENLSSNSSSSTLVSQGPDIDVYTFTEKVDSPKSILSDFRNPLNKNVGRVRPIARVKGTVIDKKIETEKKKFSPHRQIEEVVKQLKANKHSEELKACGSGSDSSVCDANVMGAADKPKAIASKSYKMVARKSNITGKPYSPIKFLENENSIRKITKSVKLPTDKKFKKQRKICTLSDDDIDHSKFSINTSRDSSSEDSVSESNDDNDTKESSGSDTAKSRAKSKKYKRITDVKKNTSKELRELSKDSLIDLKDDSMLIGNEKPSKRRLKLLTMWSGPKKHRMASLNALAKVHCLYENESRTHVELGLMRTVDKPVMVTAKPSTSKKKDVKQKVVEIDGNVSESESDKKREESSDSSDDTPPQRVLRGVPGIRSAGKYWDPKSSSSSEDSEMETKKKRINPEKKKITSKTSKSESAKTSAIAKKPVAPIKKKRNRNEVVMDLKDMVVQKRMASLNATAILAASYEKRSPKSSNKDETTSDSCSDESFFQKSKNASSSGVKSEVKIEDTKKEAKKEASDESTMTDNKQKVEVIVNQDTDVTITGVYSTHHHEGFCTVSGTTQYRISSTSHTQTTATANCEKEGCSREDGTRYTPLTALSSMQPPAEHPQQPPDLGGLSRRAGCSSAFSAPSASTHHEPGKPAERELERCETMPFPSYGDGYYQPAGPLIKETGAEAERTLARYHPPPPPHYHPPHPPMLQQYGGPYYPADLCYGRYYRPPGQYHMQPPQPDSQIVGVGSEPYHPPPQYYGTPPCYHHSPQRVPYIEYRGCPCPLNACPKNGLIGPATGKAPTGGGPGEVPMVVAPPGGYRSTRPDAHSGKDPPAASTAPEPKREPGPRPRPHHEPAGPPSPARGSAGACAPHPPVPAPPAPRKARVGKAMARRSLAGDDTSLLLSSATAPPPTAPSPADDDVLALSPPPAAPIDLSSSDERLPPLFDVKKENEGPTCTSPRKADAQALREQNATVTAEAADSTDAGKAAKRRYSRPKLEIDMQGVHLEVSCKTNGIGEHVKLQKRRKVSSEQTELTTVVVKETKKRSPQKAQRMQEQKSLKRKSDLSTIAEEPSAKRPANESNVGLQMKASEIAKNTILDKKNSANKQKVQRSKSSSSEVAQKTNINNNIVENRTLSPIRSATTLGPGAVSTTQNINNSNINKTTVFKNFTKTCPNKEDSCDSKVDKINECDKQKSLQEQEPVNISVKSSACDKTSGDESKSQNMQKETCASNDAETKRLKSLADKASAIVNRLKESVSDKKVEAMKRCKLVKEKKSVEKAKLLIQKRPVIKTDEAITVVEDACASPTPSLARVGRAGRRGRRRSGGSRRVRRMPTPLDLPDLHQRGPLKWSNGWKWDGDCYVSKVYLNNDSRLDRPARCWLRMVHESGDSVVRGDCVLLRATTTKEQPFVARIARMWENPENGEMMVSLVWYYRPEHTELGRQPADAPDEVFASRHRDANSVACIEDKCYVLTFNEYCRYRKRLKAAEEGVTITPSIVPPMPAADVHPAIATNDSKLPPTVSPELVLFCRKIYDFRSKKIQAPNK